MRIACPDRTAKRSHADRTSAAGHAEEVAVKRSMRSTVVVDDNVVAAEAGPRGDLEGSPFVVGRVSQRSGLWAYGRTREVIDRRPMMRRPLAVAGLVLAALVPVAAPHAVASTPRADPETVPFDDARLKIEYNATDGDAGLQFFIDAEAWRHVTVTNPQGGTVLDVDAARVIRNYGLSELFSESSEPPFTEFPFAEFKKLFPEGVYTFRGQDIDGQQLKSTFTLTHAVPDGPDDHVAGRRSDPCGRAG